jgi:transposase-like protein
LIAVRWYLRYGLSYRDLEELLAERGIEVDHVTLFRWVQRFTPLLIDAARPCRHSVGSHWFVDETYVKVSGSWRYVYRAVDQYGQVIDVFVSKKRDLKAATTFFTSLITAHGQPTEITTDEAVARTLPERVFMRSSDESPRQICSLDPLPHGYARVLVRATASDRAHALVRVITELLPAALHDTDQYANNRPEADHGRLKARLRPMRGLKRDRTASVVIRGHALIQNLRRGHYELGVDARPGLTLAAAFDELALVI